MGQGGFLTLTNATGEIWKKEAQSHYQMNSWNFPNEIQPYSTEVVYVEWDQGFGKHHRDDAGDVFYRMSDSQENFHIKARNSHGFNLSVVFLNFSVRGQNQGSEMSLGWKHNGTISFIITGKRRAYLSNTSNCQYWMDDYQNVIGDRTLRDISLPGSHDAGMSAMNGSTGFASKCNTLTQSFGIGSQLNFGTRYFDIRPAISAGNYVTGHYSKVDALNSWQGANGQSIDSIISEINDFTASNKKEVVILSLSKTLNTDVGNSSYRPFDSNEWNNLFNKLKTINHRYSNKTIGQTDISTLNIEEITSNGAAVIMIVHDQGVIPTDLFGDGFYYPQNLPVYDNYSGTNDAAHMMNDQLDKMRAQVGNYFLLSWTLTQDSTQASTCFTGFASSIKDLALKANQDLMARVYPVTDGNILPNIIYTDYIENNLPAMLAISINLKRHSKLLKVGLKSVKNNKYVAAENAGDKPLIANRDALNTWETFELEFLSPATGKGENEVMVTLRSVANNKYVCNEHGGQGNLIANRKYDYAWEKFRIVYFGTFTNGQLGLLASNGRYVSVTPNLELKATAKEAGPNEKFTMEILAA